MSKSLSILAVCGLLLAACGQDSDSPETAAQNGTTEQKNTTTQSDRSQPGTTAPTTTPQKDQAQTCQNQKAGFTVQYPGDWHANSGDVAPPCSYFDRKPVEVPAATEFHTAVEIHHQPVPMRRAAAGDSASRVTEREEMRLAGRAAIREEVVATGDALLPSGTRTYHYLIEDGNNTLFVSTVDTNAAAYRQNREKVDEIASSLRFG